MAGQSGWAQTSRRLTPYLDPAIGVVAAALALLSHLNSDIASIDPRLHEPDIVSAVATVAAAGALAWRRSRPATSYAVMVGGSLVVTLTDHYIGLLSVLILVSLYSFAAHGRRRDALIGFGAGVVCFVALALLNVPDLGTSVLLQSLALLTAAWAFGDAIRSRRRQQQERLEAAVTEERLRIARELHDVVAHSMSLIAVQAGVGAHVIRTDLDAAERTLEVIADTSRQALEQTRSMLGMLRDEDDDGTRRPTQSLDDLPRLVQDMRAAGLEAHLARRGVDHDLDPAVSLTAYRIVQESLTNVVKHSEASTATVNLTATDGALTIEVVDPGPSRATSTSTRGHGLVGLEERVRLVGGTVNHSSRGSGFRVSATLPLTGARR